MNEKKRFDRMTVKETMAYYDARNKAMQRDKCINFDTFVRVVKGQAVPVEIADARGMEV